MRILIDMDDVLTECVSIWINYLNEKTGKSLTHDDITDWNLRVSYPELTETEITEPLLNSEFWSKVSPLKDAVKCVKKFLKDGHEVVVVSASYPLSYSYKLVVLDKFFPFIPHDNVVIAHNKSFVDGDVLIDDNPKNLENRSGYGILFSAPHNRNYAVNNKNIFRADSWKEAYKLICHMNGDNNG